MTKCEKVRQLDVQKTSIEKVNEDLHNKSIADVQYEQAKSNERIKSVDQRIQLNLVLHYVKCFAVIILSVLIFSCLIVLYGVAILQFIGHPPNEVEENISWLIRDTLATVVGGIFGWMVCKYLK